MNLQTVVRALFVYIPFGFCVLIQIGALLTLLTEDNSKALMLKVAIPVLFIIGVVVFIKNQKKDDL